MNLRKHFDNYFSSFSDRVYQAVRKIPKGKVTTYAAVALAIGKPKAVRAVGNALHGNPYAPVVPCHRVIRSDGRVGGFASGSRKKSTLLKREGVAITRERINLREFGWRVIA